MSHRLNLLAPEVRANPYPYYAELRRSAPVCQVDPGGIWAVSRYDDVALVLKNAELFSAKGGRIALLPPWLDRNPMVDSILLMDPPEHTKARAIVSRAFSTRVIPRIEPLLRAAGRGFVERLTPGCELDFCAELAVPIPATAIADLLGLDPALRAHFKRWTAAFVAIAAATPEMREGIRTTIVELEQYLREVIAARRAAPRDDLVSELLAARIDGVALTEPEIVSFLFLLLAAGFETTTHLLNAAMKIFTDHPEVYARVRADPALVPAFIEEVLRFEPSAHIAIRHVKADVEIRGVKLPAGTLVAALISSANRDEQVFPDPDRFDLDRERQVGLSFGYGAHFCLGAALARAEAKIGIEVLTSLPGRFEWAGRAPEWNISLTLRGLKECWVRYVL
ncbi:cytochrome P450 [Sorangium cellulosum]|uniref:Cytochrome P450 n=1 Tax=Sorangium cellulosum TaxID=56 RepID=A0A2L0EU79_SORCE|nr:cytochrome P450 [Sorangium cellulosum]AUX42857.1 cytochrome P450 [Sorangium cellulosum]